MGSLIGKDRLLAVAAIRTKRVEVGGEDVLVREMYADEFVGYVKQRQTEPGKAAAYLLQCCVIGEDGEPLLTSEDAEALVKSLRVGVPLIQAVLTLSGFGDDEKEPDAS